MAYAPKPGQQYTGQGVPILDKKSGVMTSSVTGQQLGAGDFTPSFSPVQDFQKQQIGQFGQGAQMAAQSMLQGAEQYGDYMRQYEQALPGAQQMLYGQMADAVAAGAAQSGRGGASAYGGALQGGLMAGQQAAGFQLSGAQQLADMAAQQANMQSQGYATQAAAAGKMLELGLPEQMQQQRLQQIQADITAIIAAADESALFGYDEAELRSGFQRLMSQYTDDPAMQQYIRAQMQQVMQTYG